MSFKSEQEEDRIDARKLAAIGTVGTLVFAVALVAANFLLQTRGIEHAPSAPETPPSGTISRTLIAETRAGLDLRQAQREALTRFEWIDRDAGVAKIPIERAIDIVAADPSLAERSAARP